MFGRRLVGWADPALWSRWAVPALLLFACGCYRQDMARQPKYHWPDSTALRIGPWSWVRGMTRAANPTT